jgi:hypothetical protein
MAKRQNMKISDLPQAAELGQFIVVNPAITANLTSFNHLKSKGATWAALSHSARSLTDLVHMGSLTCFRDNPIPGQPCGYHVCGGRLKFTALPTSRPEPGLSAMAKTKIICSAEQCNMKLGTNLSMEELKNLLTQLMLKQAAPDLKYHHYIACDQLTAKQESRKEVRTKLRNIGTIAVMTNVLCGYINNGYFDPGPRPYGLAFTALPGLSPFKRSTGLKEWRQYLIAEYYAPLEEALVG